MAILRNVAKTDTLEGQRQKINLIAQDLYDLTGGSSSVGFDKISFGNGTVSLPSITFSTDSSLGLFKLSSKTLGIASNQTLIQSFSSDGIYSKKDFIFSKTAISSGGITLSSSGSNYDVGSYTQISLVGGTGSGAKGSFTVIPYTGTITNSGTGYTADDSFSGIKLNGGSGSGAIFFIATNLSGNVSTVSIENYGTGYSVNDILTLPGQQTGISTVLSTSSAQITVSSTALIQVGSSVSGTGFGTLAANTTVLSIDSATTLTLSANPTVSGSFTATFTPPYGTGSGFAYTISSTGLVDSVSVTDYGNGYSISDVLTVSPSDLTQPITYAVKNANVQIITLTGTVSLATSGLTVGSSLEKSDGSNSQIIRKIVTSGSNISFIVVDGSGFSATDVVQKTGTITPTFTINTATNKNQFFINTGSNYTYLPDVTLYSGNIYIFDLSDISNVGHSFSLSKHPDGTFNTITNISSTLSSTSAQITVSSTTGILPGMSVTKTSGSGVLASSTTVLTVNSATSLTLSNIPLVSGSVVLSFDGTEFTDSTVRVSNVSLTVKPNSLYPASLYYYAAESADEGGSNGYESVITINQSNPKVFGSGFQSTVTSIDSTQPIKSEILTGKFTANIIESTTGTIQSVTSTGSSTFNNLSATLLSTSSISSTTANLVLNATGYNISNTCNLFYVGSNLNIDGSSGNLTTSGIIKSTGSFNSNNQLSISGNTIQSAISYNLVLSPSTDQTVKVTGTTALTIPSGTTLERPTTSAESGSIRYNTTTGQFEGYSGVNWSSLGGVRDIDGDTYILAEKTAGSNDNTLFFYGGGLESARISSSGLNLINTSVSSISSSTIQGVNIWTATTALLLNSYIYYGINVYKVTTAGTTGSTTPTHTSGAVSNGTAVLTWDRSVLGTVNFGASKKVSFSCPAEFGGTGGTGTDLKIENNTISSLINDIVISPLEGKKTTIASTSSLVVPAGTTSQRGVSSAGGVRFNTENSAFEGYTGTNWTSLGGIRDVDGNTYILPESSPGANENTLYFYNNGINTLNLTQTELIFNNIDTISSTNNNLDINVSSITLDSLSASLAVTTNTTKLSTSKTNLDFGLSSGLANDSLIRLNSSGEIYVNTTFGLGTGFNGTKVLDKTLKVFELDDVLLQTSEVTLVKGTNNFIDFVIYNPSTYYSAKVTLSSLNTTVNQKHIVDYNVTNNSTDIFKVEYGKIVTNGDLFDTSFDYDISGNVRITVTLSNNVSVGNSVLVKLIKTLVKS